MLAVVGFKEGQVRLLREVTMTSEDDMLFSLLRQTRRGSNCFLQWPQRLRPVQVADG